MTFLEFLKLALLSVSPWAIRETPTIIFAPVAPR
jgi:hypothetical protein